jgi:hypothetical protein
MSTKGTGSVTLNDIDFPYYWEYEDNMFHIAIASIGYDEWHDDLLWGKSSKVVRAFAQNVIEQRHEREVEKMRKWNEGARA